MCCPGGVRCRGGVSPSWALASELSASPGAAFPPPLDSYQDGSVSSLGAVLVGRIHAEPFNHLFRHSHDAQFQRHFGILQLALVGEELGNRRVNRGRLIDDQCPRHRVVVDGALAARWLAAFTTRLEHPLATIV